MGEWTHLSRRVAGLAAETELVDGTPGGLFLLVYGWNQLVYGWNQKHLAEIRSDYWDEVGLQTGISRYENDVLAVADMLRPRCIRP